MPTLRRFTMVCGFGMWSVLCMILAAPGIAQMLPGPVPEKDDPMEWTNISVGARVHCPGMGWPTYHDGAVFSNFFRIDFSGTCGANGGPGASGSFPARHGGIAWSGGFSNKWQTTTWLSSAHIGGKSGAFPYTAYPIDRVLVYDPDRVIRQCDHSMGGCLPAAYDTSQSGLLPGTLPARVLLFDWGQLRPVYDPSLELTEKPYLKDPTRPEADNLDTIFLLRDDMTVLSGDGILSDANGWWTAWFGRGDVLLTRLRPDAFTLPGYDPPANALSDSPPVAIDASDMNYWIETVMAGYPYLYEPLKLTYSPPLGHRVRNDPDNDRRAQVWLHPDYEPQRAPYTLIGQAYSFPLVTGTLHTADADICPLTQDAEGNTTCMAHPYFGSDAPQDGLPPAERTTPVYTFSAPAAPDEEVWLELSATWWETRTTPENQAQSGQSGGVEIAHPKGILTSLKPDGASHLEQRLHWRLVTPSNRPDLLETLPATIKSGPFTRLIPRARLNVTEPGVYDVELLIRGGTGDPSDMNGEALIIDKARFSTLAINLTAYWPSPSKHASHPGPAVSEQEEDDPLNLFLAVNDDDDNGDHIMDSAGSGDSGVSPEDDELLALTINQFDPLIGTLTLSADAKLHLFTKDGKRELSLPMTLDIANPPGPAMLDHCPLAEVLDGETTFLVEAEAVSDDAVITLSYTRDGQELARDEVHLTIVNPNIDGGFTRGDIDPESPQGTVQYRAMLPLAGTETEAGSPPNRQWLWGEPRADTHPYALVVPIPDSIRTAANRYSQDGKATGLFLEYKAQDAATWTAGELLTDAVFTSLAQTYNTISSHLFALPEVFTAEALTADVSTAMGLSPDAVPGDPQEARYGIITNLTEPGLYEVRWYTEATNPFLPMRKMLFGSTEGVLVRTDLTIHHGNATRDEVVVDREETRGAFTVVNRNDTDADGLVDYQDPNGVLHTQAQPGITGQDEVDLMKLVLSPPLPDSLLASPELTDTVFVDIVSGSDQVVLWQESTKETRISSNSTGRYAFSAKTLHEVWVEVTAPSAAIGDIVLQLMYPVGDVETTDIVTATGIWPEIDVREAARHENRVGRNDPRLCQDLSKTDDDCLALNKLLVWHDSQSDESITFEIVKTDVPDETQTLDNKSPLWVQIEEKNHLNMNTWASCNCQFKLLEQDIERYPSLSISSNPHLSYPILIALAAGEQVINLPDSFVRDREDYFIGDFVVAYGIDYDDSKTLAGEEVKGMYEIFGVTTDDFREAQLRYDDIYLKWTVWDLAQSLCFRFSHGEWEEPEDYDYRPDKDGSCAPGRKNEGGPNDSCVPDYEEQITIDDLTHNLGASFSNHTSVIQYVEDHAGASKYPRQYYNAESVKIPIYEYSPSSDASELIRTSEYFRERVARFLLTKYSFADIDNSYKNAAGQNTRTISMPFTSYSINVEAYKAIGLGWATLNPASSASLTIPFTPGAITFSVTQIDSDTYEIDHDVQVRATVFDRWDYNYFKPGLAHTTLASVSGSSIQSGFDMFTQGPEKPGQVASEIYFIDDNVDLLSGPEVVEIFQLFFYNEKTIRIDRTTGDWFIFIKDVEAKYAKEYLYDENN